MEQLDLKEMMDHQRWLIDNGLFTDHIKDNLHLFGSLVHKEILALHTKIDVENKVINYDMYVSLGLLKKINLFNKLTNSTSIIDMWRLKRLIKKEGNFNFNAILNKFVKDFCGPLWSAKANIKNINTYVDNLDEQRTTENQEPNR